MAKVADVILVTANIVNRDPAHAVLIEVLNQYMFVEI